MILSNHLYSFYIPKFFGLAPHWFKSKNNVYEKSILGFLYSAVILAALITYIWACFFKNVENPGYKLGSLTTLVSTTAYVLNVTFTQGSTLSAHNSIKDTAEDLSKLVKFSFKKIWLQTFIELLITIVLVVLIIWFEYVKQGNNVSVWYTWVVTVILFAIKTAFVYKFTWMIRMIRCMYDTINDEIEKETVYLGNNLKELGHLHERLTYSTMMLNKSFSLSFLFFSCDSFVRLCYSAFTLIVCQLYFENEECVIDTPLNAVTFLWFAFQLWTLIGSCQSAIEGASNTTTIVHKILRHIDEFHPNTEKLETISYQTLQKVQFSACGFFDIDFAFMTTLVGLVTTYVIIFVQFRVVTVTNKTVAAPNDMYIQSMLKNLTTVMKKVNITSIENKY